MGVENLRSTDESDFVKQGCCVRREGSSLRAQVEINRDTLTHE